MDVSILQHAKDKAPRQMALDEVVELIRGDAWPAGYQPLAVMASVVSGGVMRNSNLQKPETFLVYVRKVSFFIFIPPVRTRGMFSKKQRIIWKYEIKFVLLQRRKKLKSWM